MSTKIWWVCFLVLVRILYCYMNSAEILCSNWFKPSWPQCMGLWKLGGIHGARSPSWKKCANCSDINLKFTVNLLNRVILTHCSLFMQITGNSCHKIFCPCRAGDAVNPVKLSYSLITTQNGCSASYCVSVIGVPKIGALVLHLRPLGCLGIDPKTRLVLD